MKASTKGVDCAPRHRWAIAMEPARPPSKTPTATSLTAEFDVGSLKHGPLATLGDSRRAARGRLPSGRALGEHRVSCSITLQGASR
jgi:hypothetical protein